MSSTKTAKPARCLYRSGSALSSSRIRNLCLAAGLLISARQRARAADRTPRLNASLNLNQCERSLLRALGAYELKPRLTHRAKGISDDLSPWLGLLLFILKPLGDPRLCESEDSFDVLKCRSRIVVKSHKTVPILLSGSNLIDRKTRLLHDSCAMRKASAYVHCGLLDRRIETKRCGFRTQNTIISPIPLRFRTEDFFSAANDCHITLGYWRTNVTVIWRRCRSHLRILRWS